MKSMFLTSTKLDLDILCYMIYKIINSLLIIAIFRLSRSPEPSIKRVVLGMFSLTVVLEQEEHQNFS